MKARGVFGIMAGAMFAMLSSVKGIFRKRDRKHHTMGRMAFYNVSSPRRANQRKNYMKGWAK